MIVFHLLNEFVLIMDDIDAAPFNVAEFWMQVLLRTKF